MAAISILQAGPLTSVQDLGRARRRREGIAVGGALDPLAARLTNLLVGNEEGSALLEITLGGLRLRFEDDRTVAWSGATLSARLGEGEIPAGRPAVVRAGEELEFGQASAGCRAWLAISGGIDVPLVLNSRSTDLRTGFGGYVGRALRDGDQISLGSASPPGPRSPRLADWSATAEWTQTAVTAPVLRVVRGSEWDEFVREAQSSLLRESFTVSAKADRMGVRLEGPILKRANDWELPSEAVAPGTLQVAHDGQPILLLGDCQTIGGYPKIAHVITVDLPRAAQLRPGVTVRFQEITLAEATALFLERERSLQLFRVGLSLRGE
ncbi:MAG: biotin-dependent carboxyltransferase family protein [Spartobacteria bacterium]